MVVKGKSKIHIIKIYYLIVTIGTVNKILCFPGKKPHKNLLKMDFGFMPPFNFKKPFKTKLWIKYY